MAQTSEDKRLKEVQLQDRRDRLVAEIRIWDLLHELGINGDEAYKGKLHCIFPSHSEKTPSMKVYLETDSVYCFGCSGSGDVVEVARRCAGDGKAWSLERTLDWLEARFDIEPLPKLVTFTDRLKSKLGKWREDSSASEEISPTLLASTIVDQMELAVQGINPEIKVALIKVEDYIWEEFDRPGVDHHAWYQWASKFVSGYYNRTIDEMRSWFDSPEYQAGLLEIEVEAQLLADDHLSADKAGSP